jgi:hypothetical protein
MGAEGKLQAGPIKLEGKANVASVSGKVTKDGAEITAKGLNASGSASFASAKAGISVTGLNGKVKYDGERITTEGSTILDSQNRSGTLTLGDNGFEMTANNSTVVAIGFGGSLFGLGGRIEGSVNLGEAVQGVTTLVEAGLSYAADLYDNLSD